jgi:cyclophilin family peptidyl-prolyl cis-trans isomerase
MVRLFVFLFAFALAPAAHAQSDQNTLTLETTKGRIVIRLRADIAPQHAARLRTLAREKYYDNAPFHRVIEGFMAQTGDGERGDGTGKSKYPDLRAEFSNVPFTRGVVGMARGAHSNDSANSQFFIVFGEAPGLNGQYTVVGNVVSGMETVDKLKKGSRAQDGKVTDPDRIVSAR